MRTVHINAVNVKPDDIIAKGEGSGCRVKSVHHYGRRVQGSNLSKLAHKGIGVLYTPRSGNDIKLLKLVGDECLVIRRPLKNMEHRRKK